MAVPPEAHAALHWAIAECGANVSALNNVIRTLIGIETYATQGVAKSRNDRVPERRMQVLAVLIGADIGPTRDGQDIALEFGVSRETIRKDAMKLRHIGLSWPVSGGGNGAKHRRSCEIGNAMRHKGHKTNACPSWCSEGYVRRNA